MTSLRVGVFFVFCCPTYLNHYVFVDPLDETVDDFTNTHGSNFQGPTQLMRRTALKHILKPNRQVELTPSLLEKTYTVNHSEGRSHTGVTPLYWACKTSQKNNALLFIKAGANVNAHVINTDGKIVSPPLYEAARHGMNKVVKKMLEKEVDRVETEIKETTRIKI